MSFEEDIMREYLESKGWEENQIDEFISSENIKEAYENHMKSFHINHMKKKIKNSLRAYIMGDALGVPYESEMKGRFYCKGFTGGGTHQQEAGTWSDDTSVMLCLLDALTKAEDKYEAVDLLKENLKAWYHDGKFTTDGIVFDVGRQTAASIDCNFRNDRLTDRMGNGALFYVPITFYFMDKPFVKEDFEMFCKVTHNNRNCFDYGWKLCQILGSCMDDRVKEIPIPPTQNRGDVKHTFYYVLDYFYAIRHRDRKTPLFDCLCEIVNKGEDTDTNAALLGLLLGTEREVDEKDWEQVRKHEFADKIINDFIRSVSEFEELNSWISTPSI